MKISVMAGRYALSGVPLAQMRFSRALAARGHEVDFVIGMVNAGSEAPVLQGVRTLVLGKARVSSTLPPLIRYFREQKPELVFTAGDHLNAIVLLAAILSGSKAKISCSSRVTPFDTYSNQLFSKGWILKWIIRLVMWRADALTCVSWGTVREYQKVFGSTRHVCVYNIIDDEPSRSRMKVSVSHDWLVRKQVPVLVAAGMLAPWKGYADLIHAMKVLYETRRVRLIILGDGPLRSELQALIEELNLVDVVCLMGYVENPLKYLVHADLFVHSAHVESLGNVLVEAMMCGCTVVSTDCPTGPREVLQDGRFGYLVPMRDPVAMASAIELALDNPIPQPLLLEAVEPFSENCVLEQHFKLLGIVGDP